MATKRNRNKEYNAFTEAAFTIEELKSLLGVEDKYPRFNNFRQKVLEIAQEEINGRTSLYFEIACKYGNNREKKIEKIQFTIFDSEKEAKEYAQNGLKIEAKKEVSQNAYQGKPFDMSDFKKGFPKIYTAIKTKVIEHHKDLGNGQLMMNFDKITENSITGLCESYFNFFISQSITEPSKIANTKDMFEKMGIPIQIK